MQRTYEQYAPLISNIIRSDMCFFALKKQVRWTFFFNERPAVFGAYSRKEDVLQLNIASVVTAFEKNEPLQIEYFLLHEIRHIFQYSQIDDMESGRETVISPGTLKKWVEETEQYHGPINADGSQNKQYFEQGMEFDAFVFSTAVMRYKYGDVSYIKPPAQYGEKFYAAVAEVYDDLAKRGYPRAG